MLKKDVQQQVPLVSGGLWEGLHLCAGSQAGSTRRDLLVRESGGCDPALTKCRARDGDKHSSGRIQILHYNIDRFPTEIKDLRGLETLLIARCVLDIRAYRAERC